MFLFFDVFLVCVADKIDVFPYFFRFAVLWRVERVLLLKFVEAGAINLGLRLGLVWCVGLFDPVPVNAAEKLMLHDLLYTVSAESVFSVTH